MEHYIIAIEDLKKEINTLQDDNNKLKEIIQEHDKDRLLTYFKKSFNCSCVILFFAIIIWASLSTSLLWVCRNPWIHKLE